MHLDREALDQHATIGSAAYRRLRRLQRSRVHFALGCRGTQVPPLPLTDARHCSSVAYMQWRAPCILEHQACDRAFAGVAKAAKLIAIATVLAAKINFCI